MYRAGKWTLTNASKVSIGLDLQLQELWLCKQRYRLTSPVMSTTVVAAVSDCMSKALSWTRIPKLRIACEIPRFVSATLAGKRIVPTDIPCTAVRNVHNRKRASQRKPACSLTGGVALVRISWYEELSPTNSGSGYLTSSVDFQL